MRYVGIDPGVTGAVAHIWQDGTVGIQDLPTMVIEGKKRRTVLDEHGAFQMLQSLACVDGAVTFLLEAAVFGPAAKKKEESEDGVGHSIITVANSFLLVGQLRGILAALAAMYGIKREITQPQVWKRAMMPGEARDKEAARQKAIQLYPSIAEDLKLKKHHNRAEALLLAEYGRRRG